MMHGHSFSLPNDEGKRGPAAKRAISREIDPVANLPIEWASLSGRVERPLAVREHSPGSPGSPGILPLCQVPVIVPSSLESTAVLVGNANYPLVGSGEPLEDCGTGFARVCCNVDEHPGKKMYWRKYLRHCGRPVCPTCWESWASRQTKRAMRRFKVLESPEGRQKLLKRFIGKKSNRKTRRKWTKLIEGSKAIHVTVSLPLKMFGFSLEQMREAAYQALAACGMSGGIMIYHSKRKHFSGEWYFAPHLHILGFGWIVDTEKYYHKTGIVVRNLRIRKTLSGTVWYQLSHAGIDPTHRHNTVTWFGCMSYNKMHMSKDVEEHDLCPYCGRELKEAVWVGPGESPIKNAVEGEDGLNGSFSDWEIVPSPFDMFQFLRDRPSPCTPRRRLKFGEF